MTGYTVHTGTSLKFSASWDRIFKGAKASKVSGESTVKVAKKFATKSAKKVTAKPAVVKAVKKVAKKKAAKKTVKRGK